jgi:UDP-N-acetylglucosamine/UDP-N-acetylgalactosamine diphosphorylase
VALKFWYKHIRPLFAYDDFSRALIIGMQDNLDTCIDERIYRLKIFCEKLGLSKDILLSQTKDKHSKLIILHDQAMDGFSRATQTFEAECNNETIAKEGEAFIQAVEKQISRTEKKYIPVIQNLESDEIQKGSQWLFDIEQGMVEKLLIG